VRRAMALLTKRMILAHVIVCRGCCCGAVERGKPEVPIEWLKDEWNRRGLKSSIQLTISGCLGPCDLPNVASISSAAGTVWLGAIRAHQTYAALLEWASAITAAEFVQPLPADLSDLRFSPFRFVDAAAQLDPVE
jgi:predicted metal-binding protein